MNITFQEYVAEVQAIAHSIVAEVAQGNELNTLDTFDADAIRDLIYDTYLHETIDGHQWVIYNAYNLDVYQHSNNQDYMEDNIGLDGALNNGLQSLHTALAYWCLYADVSDALEQAINDYEEQLSARE